MIDRRRDEAMRDVLLDIIGGGEQDAIRGLETYLVFVG